MEEEIVWQKLTAVFENVLDVESPQLTRETTADDIPEWDSVAHVQLMIAVEKTFGFRFRTAEIAALKNVGDLVDAIRQKNGGLR